MTTLPEAARDALGDAQLRRNLRNATTTIRDKRARVVAEVPDWEELREAGPRDQGATPCADLDELLLEQFEAAVQAAGGARALGARRRRGERDRRSTSRARTASTEVVKVKSLTTDEIELNDALAARGHPARSRPTSPS